MMGLASRLALYQVCISSLDINFHTYLGEGL